MQNPEELKQDIYDLGVEWAYRANAAWDQMQFAQHNIEQYAGFELDESTNLRGRMIETATKRLADSQQALVVAEEMVGILIGMNNKTLEPLGLVLESPYKRSNDT